MSRAVVGTRASTPLFQLETATETDTLTPPSRRTPRAWSRRPIEATAGRDREGGIVSSAKQPWTTFGTWTRSSFQTTTPRGNSRVRLQGALCGKGMQSIRLPFEQRQSEPCISDVGNKSVSYFSNSSRAHGNGCQCAPLVSGQHHRLDTESGRVYLREKIDSHSTVL